MIDADIKQLITDLHHVLVPDAVIRIEKHIGSMVQKIEDLTNSRENWKKKYQDLKSGLGKNSNKEDDEENQA